MVGIILESEEFVLKGTIIFSLKSLDYELNFALHFISLLLSHCYKIFSFTKLEGNLKLKITFYSYDLDIWDFGGGIVSYDESR